MVKSLHQRVVLMSAKKNSQKDRQRTIFIHQTKFLISMRCSRRWCAVGVHVVDETRATTRKKVAKQKRAFLPPFIGILALCSKRETRERDEKEIQRYLKLRWLVSRSLPFSSRCGCFSCGTKKTTQIVRKARTLATVRFLNWLETAENCVSWVVCCDEKKLFWTSVSRLLSSRWLRETRLIFATRVKGIINTHVGCKFTRDRKKKKTSARARA